MLLKLRILLLLLGAASGLFIVLQGYASRIFEYGHISTVEPEAD